MIKTQEALMASITLTKSIQPDDDDLGGLQDMEDELEQSLLQEMLENQGDEEELELKKAMDLVEEIKKEEMRGIEDVPRQMETSIGLDEENMTGLRDDELNLENFLVQEDGEVGSSYEKTYAKTISGLSDLVETPKEGASLDTIANMCSQVWSLVDDWRNQTKQVQQNCYRETLLKGLLALMKTKDSRAIMRICKGIVHIYDVLYNEKMKDSPEQRLDDNQFCNVAVSLKNNMKVLFQMSKDKSVDKMFLEENMIEDQLRMVEEYFFGEDALTQLTSKVIKREGKNITIQNIELVNEFYLYTTGTVKNISENKKILTALHNKNALIIYTDLANKVMEHKDAKFPQLLVQVTGTLRNLAMSPHCVQQFVEEGALVTIAKMIPEFINHKELILNIMRILSKVSNNKDALNLMNSFGEDFTIGLTQILTKYRENLTIMIRAAYVLGNLTTDFPEARNHILTKKYFPDLLNIAQRLFKQDEAKEKENHGKETGADFNQSNTEDAITKIIRLIANLLTEDNI